MSQGPKTVSSSPELEKYSKGTGVRAAATKMMDMSTATMAAKK